MEKSDEDTASSSLRRELQCTINNNVLDSGQSLGGHLNSHYWDRSFMQAAPNILESALDDPILPIDVYSLAVVLAQPSFTKDPPTGVQPRFNRQENKFIIGQGSGNHQDELKVKHGSSYYHPYERQVSEESWRQHCTKNLLGEWKPIQAVKEKAALQKSFERILSDPDVGVSKGDTVDLELSLKTSEALDLEIKLGF